MAELFLACVSGAGGFRKYVALKRILPDFKNQEEFVTMFLDEARITAALSHANIAQVFELGQHERDFYLAMEFVEGQDLSRISHRVSRFNAKIPLGFSAAVIRDTCNALHYAHHFTKPNGEPQAVIHRDLSLRNIMVNYSGTTKLIDFGIAKMGGKTTSSNTQAGVIKGSFGYMSPEQVRGKDVGPQSDLFTAASVLYALMTGHRMYEGLDPVATMYQLLNEPPPAPRAENPDIPKELEEVLMHALEKDPAKRFATGREMAKAIERAIKCFDDEERMAWMEANFADAISSTRQILALADETDPAEVEKMAEALKQREPVDAADEVTIVDGVPLGVGEQPSASAPPPPVIEARKNPTILVVDDVRVGRVLVRGVLQAEGYRVFDVESGTEALDVLEQLRPDLIVLDVQMPGLNGFEVCQKVRAKRVLRGVPVIFLSASCGIEERAQGVAVGGDDFLRKPFDGPELVARVRVHLQRAAMIAGNR